jgi:hypothetical protein
MMKKNADQQTKFPSTGVKKTKFNSTISFEIFQFKTGELFPLITP